MRRSALCFLLSISVMSYRDMPTFTPVNDECDKCPTNDFACRINQCSGGIGSKTGTGGVGTFNERIPGDWERGPVDEFKRPIPDTKSPRIEAIPPR